MSMEMEMKQLVAGVEDLVENSKRRDQEMLTKRAGWEQMLGSTEAIPQSDVSPMLGTAPLAMAASTPAPAEAAEASAAAVAAAAATTANRPRSVGFGGVITSDKPLGAPDEDKPDWHPGFADHHSGSLAYGTEYDAKSVNDQRDDVDRLGDTVSAKVSDSLAQSYPTNGEELSMARSIEQATTAGKLLNETRNAREDIADFNRTFAKKKDKMAQPRRTGRTLGVEGELQIWIFEARGLPKMDRFGHTDSFVRVEFESSAQETKVAPDTESPTFDAEFKFGVDSRQSPISMTIFDKDASSDEPVGQVQLPITQGMINGLEEQAWLDIQPMPSGLGDPSRKKSKSQLSYQPDISEGLGQVRIACTYTWPSVSSERELRKKAELGNIHVTVIGAKGLPKMDRWSHTDSYTQIELGEAIQKTTVAMDTEDPTWNEVLTFKIDSRKQLQNKLRLAVYDEDIADGDVSTSFSS